MRKTISTVAIALAVMGADSMAMAGTALASPAGGVKAGCGWTLGGSSWVYSCGTSTSTSTTSGTSSTSGTGGTATNNCVNTGTSSTCSATSTGGSASNYCVNNGTSCTTNAGTGQTVTCTSLFKNCTKP